MAVTRRKLIVSAAAGAAAASVPAIWPSWASAASAAGDVVGKITVGYQGWFACIGDGAPINGWWHWSNNWSQPPSPSNNNIKAWPDMGDYPNKYQTAYANLNNGQPATLFSSYDQSTVNAHFLSMQQNNLDTAALQRFDPNSSEGPTRDAMAGKVRTAAETYGRKFYIMYDATGWTNMATEMPADWTNKMSAHTASPMYARQNGKPVVGIWGFGFNDANHPWDAATCLSVIQWFQSQGCYVMGGVPREWRTGTGGSRSGFLGTYHAFNMISPWMVGAIGTISDVNNVYTTYTVGDVADCNANGIDYQPCVLPGDLSGRQRVHGDFMWAQFYNMVRAGVQGIYISMFDEYGEGNQIAKTAATQATVPSGSGLLSLDEDGTACSADYYLRLTGDGGKMLKGQIALTSTRPTQPVVGGDTTPPTVPGSLHMTSNTDTTVALAWNASTDDVSVAGYHVQQVSGSTSTVVASTTATSFTVTGLTASTSYTFDVTAYDAAGNVSAASNTVTVTTSAPSGNTDLALHQPATASGYTQNYVPGNAVDGDPNTYWESTDNAFPQWIQVDLGSAKSIGSLTLTLPPSTSWGARTQTITVQGSTDGTNYTTIVGSTGYTFDPASNNSVSVTLPSTTTRYVKLTFTANTGWPAGQLSGLSVFAGAGSPPPPPPSNLALNKATSASGSQSGFPSSNAVDGNTSSYWESTNNAFPQWIQVDLGSSQSISRLVMDLPPSTSWGARTQTVTIQGSTDGTNYTTLVGSAGYTFDPNTGNTVTVTFAAASVRYVKLTFTANTGWPAGQLSELQVYSS
ncbi:MAG TPA: discoidin domain-containing protein [Actinocrinis sp.]|uniref:discoidin domain-containing protein n=1 Tax=Actinocrinis sp. TaxID=1920516 RepID=UPI002DDD5893|nr:discoidin domain-containing protein [Actinocrinis sp.]HEV2345224.1 discoidin domain-containing protein [Actinocrinis sp.]